MKSMLIGCALACAATGALGQQVLFEQALTSGTARQSQLWVDPSGQNDSDTDAIAWEDFTLAADGSVTAVRVWGQVIPQHGFRVRFYEQDPNTIAMQPDMFRPGSGPIRSETHATASLVGTSGGWYQYEIALNSPLALLGDTRYFVSVVGLTAQPFQEWRWAAGGGVNTGTFYWARSDTNMYRMMPENRGMSLLGQGVCEADLTGNGSLDFFDVSLFIEWYNTRDARSDLAAPFGVWNFFDVAEYIAMFAAGCP
ncbi:MAG: hypothetical protein D6692_09010 [Planctomycetota bacterium]|nr:MAG: hypothetical protein D6692_09010 [Planctomycetota bacterium]